MRTTIRLDDDWLRELKRQASRQHATFAFLVNLRGLRWENPAARPR